MTLTSPSLTDDMAGIGPVAASLPIAPVAPVQAGALVPVRRAGDDTVPVRRRHRRAKRVLDVALTALALVPALPVMAVCAAAVKLSSPGPVLFRQERIGLGGEPFTLVKFRSMHAGAEARLDEVLAANGQEMAPFYKPKHDPRITPVGAFLRRTSLDELPQLFNVLAGSMSLVGPRPQVRAEVDTYTDDQRRRLEVLPGITGNWQIRGRSDLTAQQGLAADLAYVDNHSLRGDLAILARTLRVVVSRRGAY